MNIGFKVHKGKIKFMTNIDTTDNIQIDGAEIQKMTNCECLEQATAMENRTRQEASIRIKAGWSSSVFGKYR